jgi:GTP-binding protein
MRVKTARFVISAAQAHQFPGDGRPEIAFAGRSNAGKSTLLNTLLKKPGLAKTSKTPGKTQLINFFDLNGQFYFVDLPGYGYAKVGKAIKRRWQSLITRYMAEREPLALTVLLVDARHTPTQQDHEMIDLLAEAEVPTLVVATKIDKVRPAQRQKALKRLRGELELDDEAIIVGSSSISKDGLRELWTAIDECLGLRTG